MDVQQVFKSMFNVVINEDYSISVEVDRYRRVLEHVSSKVDFYLGTRIYMLPPSLNLNIGKIVGDKNKILISNTEMKIVSNRNINKAGVLPSKISIIYDYVRSTLGEEPRW